MSMDFYKNKTLISFFLFLGFLFSMLVPFSVDSEELPFRVVVDAGHGGMDGGVTGKRTGVKESDLNLLVAFDLKSLLEDAGFLVTLTRETPNGVCGEDGKWYKKEDMQKRKERIESASPALVVSVHQNYYPASVATRGGQVFYLRGSETGKSLAVCVQTALNEFYGARQVKSRSAMAADYYLLKNSCPATVIVECGFLSNPDDENLLTSSNHRKNLSSSIAEGLFAYLRTL